MKTLLEYLQKKHIDVDIEEALKFSCKGTNALSLVYINNNPILYYKLSNMEDFIEWDYESIEFGNGIDLYIKGNNHNGFSSNYDSYSRFNFKTNNKVECSGNIMVLLGENINDIPCNYCFYNLFRDCSSLTTAPDLPATTLANGCYTYMFCDCISLTTAPELPATTLANYCYTCMFMNCKSLTTAPELPATTLADYCYDDMFSNCSNLTTAPKLPATKLAA